MPHIILLICGFVLGSLSYEAFSRFHESRRIKYLLSMSDPENVKRPWGEVWVIRMAHYHYETKDGIHWFRCSPTTSIHEVEGYLADRLHERFVAHNLLLHHQQAAMSDKSV